MLNPVLNPVQNANNEGDVQAKSVSDDMEHLIEVSKLDPPMIFGLCIECDNFHDVCKSARANRILQWVEDTLKYKNERAPEELQVSVNLLHPLPDNDDYTIDNVDDFIF